ncbi:PAS domain-containing protein [Jeotgalibaca sp. MA1X17-3]|uniref:PAS domain-containing protein n=1 Tax=Jeotgalibaca sp. MA1X17-3 TaxID=2908211 RepID=UPI001F234A4E|nr:PAS domain-containing protein [Jeotgalibaca sp. MA1X17-3]UJF16068.1 PAS domain-containing protein [Jeotgalibaca sp. MA1X17-3]
MEVRLKNAPCGYLKLDHKSFLIEANDTFLNEMGYKKQEVVGQHIESFLKPANKMVFHSYFYPNINLFGAVDELYIKFKNGEGEETPFLMNACQVEGDSEKFVDCILMPMRKRIDYEMELRASKKKIEDAYLKNEHALIELENIYQEIEEKQNDLLLLNEKLKRLANTDQLTEFQIVDYLK